LIRRHLFLLIFYTRKDRKGQQEVEQTGKKSKEMDMLNGGLAVGPNAALANLIGQKNRGKINSMVHTILTFGAVLRISLMVIGMLVARVILEASDVLPDRVRMFTSYEMLMNVYVASWLFTGGSMFVIYFRHMKGLERQFMGNQG
jgi:Na+-driven multidrug efflux pump